MFGRTKTIVSAREFRELAKKEVLTACDFRRPVGGQRKCILGTERVQMNISTCARITTLLVERIDAEGSVLETSLDTLHVAGGRHVFARDLLLKLAQGKRGVVSAVPAEAFLNTLGDIIRVGKGRKEDGRRAEMQYVGKLGATSIELTAAWNVTRKAKAEADARFSIPNDLYAAVVPCMPAGVTLEEYTNQALKDFHAAQVAPTPGRRR